LATRGATGLLGLHDFAGQAFGAVRQDFSASAKLDGFSHNFFGNLDVLIDFFNFHGWFSLHAFLN
jgi:hypothetical protein